ncbi:MAG: DUF934 domain-containing protein [Pseudomonadales bacterium]|nr:DUF934 domain-containing protein [Pseudomonadales bacterium]MCP5144705.1 DUF934 domain-containing protein [Gammaproteobacteria bacterium]
MMKVIKNNTVVNDAWQLVDDGAELPAGDVIVSLGRWQQERDALLARDGQVGVALTGDQDPAALADDLDQLPLIGLLFPKFTDGRNYSSARLLRERFGYKGELRALGNVLRDQLFYMQRCGIDAFALAEGRDADAALQSLRDFSKVYQDTGDSATPVWRLRGAV